MTAAKKLTVNSTAATKNSASLITSRRVLGRNGTLEFILLLMVKPGRRWAANAAV